MPALAQQTTDLQTKYGHPTSPTAALRTNDVLLSHSVWGWFALHHYCGSGWMTQAVVSWKFRFYNLVSLKLPMPICPLGSLRGFSRIQLVQFEVCWPRDQRSGGAGGSVWDSSKGRGLCSASGILQLLRSGEEQVWGWLCWRKEALIWGGRVWRCCCASGAPMSPIRGNVLSGDAYGLVVRQAICIC